MTTGSGEATRRLLGALFDLENVIRSLSGNRRAAAIDLVTDRVRRLRGRRGAAPPAAHPEVASAQIDLEEFLNGCRPARGKAKRKRTRNPGGRTGGAIPK